MKNVKNAADFTEPETEKVITHRRHGEGVRNRRTDRGESNRESFEQREAWKR